MIDIIDGIGKNINNIISKFTNETKKLENKNEKIKLEKAVKKIDSAVKQEMIKLDKYILDVNAKVSEQQIKIETAQTGQKFTARKFLRWGLVMLLLLNMGVLPIISTLVTVIGALTGVDTGTIKFIVDQIKSLINTTQPGVMSLTMGVLGLSAISTTRKIMDNKNNKKYK